MKYILMPLLLSILNCKDNSRIEKIEIRKIDFATYGAMPLQCDSFDIEAFLIDTFFITNSKDISNIMADLKSANPAPELDNVDVRAKIIISYYSGKKDSACIAAYGAFIYHSQTMLFKNKRTLEFIDSLPMKDEW